jgi:NitT/TauT family transport system substrate-binding protein
MKRTGSLVVIAAVMLVTAGCGGQAATTPQSADSGKVEKVTFVQGATEISSLPTIVATRKEYFKEQGLNVETVEVGGTAKVIAALGSGDANFGQGTMPTAFTAASQGQPTLAIVNFFAKFTMLGVVNIDALPAGVSPDAYVKLPLKERLLALKGRKLGLAGAGGLTEVTTRFLLKQVGLDPEKDVTLVNVGTSAGLLASLQQKQIDGYILPPPGTFQAVADGKAVVFFDGSKGDSAELAAFHTTNILTTPAFAEKNPGAVKKFAAAYAKAIDWAVANPDDTVKLMQTEFAKLDPEVVKKSTLWSISILAKGGRFNGGSMQQQLDILMQSGQVKHAVETNEGVVWSNQFLPK